MTCKEWGWLIAGVLMSGWPLVQTLVVWHRITKEESSFFHLIDVFSLLYLSTFIIMMTISGFKGIKIAEFLFLMKEHDYVVEMVKAVFAILTVTMGIVFVFMKRIRYPVAGLIAYFALMYWALVMLEKMSNGSGMSQLVRFCIFISFPLVFSIVAMREFREDRMEQEE
jgi:hypothetical protein